MKLRTKLLLIILLVSSILFGAIIAYITLTIRKDAISNVTKQIETASLAYANDMGSQFNYHIGVLKTYVNAIKDYEKYSLEKRRSEDTRLGTAILEENPQILAVWSSWNMSTIDSLWYFEYGRKTIGTFRSGSQIKEQDILTRDMDGHNINPYFLFIKTTRQCMVTEPYLDIFQIGSTDSIKMVSINSPIINNGEFKGIVGIDIEVNHFSELIEKIKFPFSKGYAFFSSNKGKLLATNNNQFKDNSIVDLFPNIKDKRFILEGIENGKAFSFRTTDQYGKEVIANIQPIRFHNINKTWSIGIVVPVDIVTKDADTQYYNIIFIGVLGLLLYLFVAIILSGKITQPLIEIRNVLDKIVKGEILNIHKLKVSSQDEIGKITQSTNDLITTMKSIASFSHEIEQGNLHVEYHLASKNDLLGNSIKEMQNSLIKATEENEKRKEEDRRITWTTSGIAKFSELLRQNSNDVDEFSYTIISNLVEYLQANQGAIFLINDRNPRNLYIEKKGAYAYSNRKYDEQSFEMGIGLVGRCILEAQTIFLTDIPQDYITITSGIGQANPNCLVLIPLKYNDVIYGVIEIASFKVIESYQISFLEKIGESIASSISIIKTNTQTAKLLDESQMQSEMLSSQEEEMRQNLEEMRATQEQLQVAVERSKDKEYELIEITQKQKKAIDAFERVFDSISYPIYYKDVNGKYMSCNSAYADVIGFEKNEIIGRTDFQFLSFEDAQKVEEREKNILRDKTDYAQKSLFTTKSGNVFNGLLSKKVFYDKSNRLAGIIGILIPINIIDIIKK